MVAAAAATSILSLCGSSPAFADSDAEGTAKGSPGVLSGNNVQVPLDAPVNACGNSADVVALLNPAFGNSCAHDSGSPKGGASYGDDSGYGGGGHHGHHGPSGHGTHGRTEGSPGVVSGNDATAPAEVPVNACGITADVISGLNPAYGDDCGSGGYEDTPGGYGDTPTPTPPGGHETPTPTPSSPGGPGTPTPTPTPSSPGGPGTPTPTPTPTSPGGGHETPTPTLTPPTDQSSTTPPGPNGPPPELPDTGSSEAMMAAGLGSAAMITAGAVLYRRGRRQAGAHL